MNFVGQQLNNIINISLKVEKMFGYISERYVSAMTFKVKKQYPCNLDLMNIGYSNKYKDDYFKIRSK